MKLHLELMTLTVLISASGLALANDETAQQQTLTVPAAKVAAVTAAPSVAATQQGKTTVLVSPRTGIRYSFDNPSNRPINFKTQVLMPANAQTVSRISATNPALSSESQQQAQQALLNLEQSNPAAQ
jgi:hypothetical protein